MDENAHNFKKISNAVNLGIFMEKISLDTLKGTIPDEPEIEDYIYHALSGMLLELVEELLKHKNEKEIRELFLICMMDIKMNQKPNRENNKQP